MAVTSDQARLKRQSRIFAVLAAVAVGVSLICVGSQIVVAAAPLWKGGDVNRALVNISLQVVLAAPALFYVAGLRRARQVFRRVGAGELLTLQNSRGLTAVGMCLLAGGLWSSLISDGLAPPSSDQLAVWLDQTSLVARDIALAALGLGLVMIGRVWAGAALIKAENDGFL